MKQNPLKSLISYTWILKNMPFFLFLTLLAVLYIANGHAADNTIRDINKTAEDLKELQYEYKSLKSREIFQSREDQLVQSALPLGLKISDEAPMHIKMIKQDDVKNR
ncbi:MAG: hypothetical protein JSS67_06335 [Bacteroidetes bacterium]|nr:hypothetical protein [Bacteroidota bacterium]